MGADTATVTVEVEDPTVSVAPGSLSLTEGVSGTFTVSRTGDLSAAATVYLSLGGVTGYAPPMPGSDFSGSVVSGGSIAVTGSFPFYYLEVTFAAGSSEVVVSFAPTDDGVTEGGSAAITTASGYTIDPGASSIAFYFNDP
jgi:hypothetical protein